MVCYYNFAIKKYVWPLIICTFDLMSFQTLEILGILWWHSFDNLFLAQYYFGSWQLPAFFNFILKRKLVSKQLLRVVKWANRVYWMTEGKAHISKPGGKMILAKKTLHTKIGTCKMHTYNNAFLNKSVLSS